MSLLHFTNIITLDISDKVISTSSPIIMSGFDKTQTYNQTSLYHHTRHSAHHTSAYTPLNKFSSTPYSLTYSLRTTALQECVRILNNYVTHFKKIFHV